MKVVDEMPTEGRFIRLSCFSGVTYCETLKWYKGNVCYYDDRHEAWMTVSPDDVEGATEIKYVV